MRAYLLGVATPIALAALTFAVLFVADDVKQFITRGDGWKYGYSCPACRALAYSRPMPSLLPEPIRARLGVRLAKRDHWRFWLREAELDPTDVIAKKHSDG